MLGKTQHPVLRTLGHILSRMWPRPNVRCVSGINWYAVTMEAQVENVCKIATNNFISLSLRWRHNGRDGVSNHQPHDCLLNGLFRRRSKKASKLRVTGLCVGNSPGTGEFPAQMASNAENVSIWWRHHVLCESSRNQGIWDYANYVAPCPDKHLTK